MSVFKDWGIGFRFAFQRRKKRAGYCRTRRHWDDGWSDSDARVGYRRTVVRLGPSSVSHGACCRFRLAESQRGLPWPAATPSN